ncbi:MAG: hypothetical protein CM15mP58_19260 [Burkholderiaceae bacterium]|nr:MAG: hypothetical protein CM15mP58_19260 [Burkholderiaceae bacterium]
MVFFKNEYLEIEKKIFFLRERQLIGSRSKVKKPGDVVVADFKKTIIVVFKKKAFESLFQRFSTSGGP